MDAQQLLNHSKSKDFHSEDETGYAVPHPRILAEDDSDRESTATLPDNPSPPVYQGENVGEVKTPAKRRQTGGHSHPKRQKYFVHLQSHTARMAYGFVPIVHIVAMVFSVVELGLLAYRTYLTFQVHLHSRR